MLNHKSINVTHLARDTSPPRSPVALSQRNRSSLSDFRNRRRQKILVHRILGIPVPLRSTVYIRHRCFFPPPTRLPSEPSKPLSYAFRWENQPKQGDIPFRLR